MTNALNASLHIYISVFLGLLLVLAAVTLRTYQNRLRFLQGRSLGWPIKMIALEEFDQAFKRNQFGPTIEGAEVVFLGEGDGFGAATSDVEAWILSVLSKKAKMMFEFGTCTGRTAYLWAKNSSPESRVVTLTLSPDQVSEYQGESTDNVKAMEAAVRESCHVEFVYTGTNIEHKINQIFSDSKKFDESKYAGHFDLIFVDGSHAYSYAKSDSEKALKMLKPGGIILWHDYNHLKGRTTKGVCKYLNELSAELPLVHLRRTSLVAFRSPRSTSFSDMN